MMTMDNGTETKRWEDFGVRPLRDHANPSLPRMEHKTLRIPGQSGRLGFGTEIDGREGIQIPLKKVVKEEGEINRSINAMNRFFFDAFKQPRFIKVVFDYEPSRYVWLQVADTFTIDRATMNKSLAMPFVQFDDGKYSIAEADEITWGSEEITFEADYSLGNTGTDATERLITSNTTLNPYIEGLAVHPFIVLNGSGTNVRITSNGEAIEVGNLSNQTIEIDTENAIAYRNGQEVMLNMGDFYLVPSQSVQVTGTNLNVRLTLHYRDEYL